MPRLRTADGCGVAGAASRSSAPATDAASPEGGGSPLLGYSGKYAATCDDGGAASRLERWENQAVARFLLPKEGIRYCCLRSHLPSGNVQVWHSPLHASAHYGGLMTCGSVWVCPVCAAKVSERRRELVTLAIAECRRRGGEVLLANYTVRHGRQQPLAETLAGFLAALRSLVQNGPYRRLKARYGLLGSIKALEVTWGPQNGWHPHAHVLLFAGAPVDAGALADEVYPLWKAAAARSGLSMSRLRGLELRGTTSYVDEYIAKWGHTPSRRLWEAADEVTKAHVKRGRWNNYMPFDLLRWLAETGETEARDRFVEYARVFKGRRQLVWSDHLADKLGLGPAAERSDQEIAGEVRDEAVLLALLTPDDWRLIRRRDQQGPLLEVARSGEPSALAAFMGALWSSEGGTWRAVSHAA